MPRYHFHLYDGQGLVRDEEGREHPNLAAAREAAVKDARSIIGEDTAKGLIDLTCRIEITDPEGRVLATLPFSEAVVVRTLP
jgi:hypothetical protein